MRAPRPARPPRSPARQPRDAWGPRGSAIPRQRPEWRPATPSAGQAPRLGSSYLSSAGRRAHSAEAERRTASAPPRNLLGRGESGRRNGCGRPLPPAPLGDSSRTLATGSRRCNGHSPGLARRPRPSSHSGSARRAPCVLTSRSAPSPPPSPSAVVSGTRRPSVPARWPLAAGPRHPSSRRPRLARSAPSGGAGDALQLTPAASSPVPSRELRASASRPGGP